ncbi:amino acid/amide ABC transporter ATP-binding protein 1, HAAT family [Desulfacinum hydrothermale DSM 13146]|uniref:Amino acid/amide ABC transporter ATP-binding protein 1, HAAT family n=1 Tax=Desulfacinum hydrothermale DSM 13146 TaxID=1121390 RepID=A0A1W1X0I0_9BACT|nr:ABC transporter ATP-binding protein [Desulfacinum hydrothermale]SMC17407.1 amino acid/amide ABC transporter ATP-binding protein 1, HAAT family [Desulfacinum hydrothermale DSM 13146]
MADRTILHIDGVSKAFGGVQALYRVGFRVAKGHIQAVIGPNGAGKTTLFNVITGATCPDEGRIVLEGMEIQGRPMHELVARGIARTFQNVELFASLTVLENVLVGRHVRTRCGLVGAMVRWPWVEREERGARDAAMELLGFVGLEEVAHKMSGDLPFGWQRLVEIARALASDPRLLLLDEPAAGLNAVETAALADLIQKIRSRGITVVLVEHDMNLTMDISDRIVVLDRGRKLAEGTPREIQADEAVMEAYLGRKG